MTKPAKDEDIDELIGRGIAEARAERQRTHPDVEMVGITKVRWAEFRAELERLRIAMASAHRVADEWKDCVLVCSCGWRTAARTKTAARQEWLTHTSGAEPSAQDAKKSPRSTSEAERGEGV